MVGGKIRGQRRILPEARNQCRRTDGLTRRYQLAEYARAMTGNKNTVSNVSEFLKRIKEIRDDWWSNDQDPWMPWFRGHRRADWKLQPRLYRDYGLKLARQVTYRRRNSRRICGSCASAFIYQTGGAVRLGLVFSHATFWGTNKAIGLVGRRSHRLVFCRKRQSRIL